MTLKLEIGMGCVMKEFENLHDYYLKLAHSGGGDRTEWDTGFRQLREVANNLDLVRHCVCTDRTCQFFSPDYNRCRCEGNDWCHHIVYRRDQDFRVSDSPLTLEINDDQPVQGELDYAKSIVEAARLARKQNEPFIFWKVRSANEIYQTAVRIHNQPEDGIIHYRYQTWQSENRSKRQERFIEHITDVRAVGHEDGKDFSFVVGCLIDGKMFLNEQALNAHVDRARFYGQTKHITGAFMVNTIAVFPIRATPSDYRPPPIQSPPLIQPEPNTSPSTEDMHSQVIRQAQQRITTARPARPINIVGHLVRRNEDSDFDWAAGFGSFVRTVRRAVYTRAVGCLLCGKVFETGDMWHDHMEPIHGNLSISQQLSYWIEPDNRDEEQPEEDHTYVSMDNNDDWVNDDEREPQP